ncbi:MAG TPA: glycosyltransferase family 2 protein [Clostridiales bacterium]|jgi:dolichol-phosphate mannosyltransferase|nr:glycosyltransferase family 2 protein [Clostridiales bacterium]
MKPTLSLIIPCYNEEESIQETHRRVTKVMEDLAFPYEVVYVNDGSRDGTAELLNAIQAEDKAVRLIHFAANRGHQVAVTAGLDYAQGEAAVILDADLQDPPEVIPEMVQKWQEGYQVVYGQRRSRQGESKFKLWTASAYYKLMQKLVGKNFHRDTGDFRLVDRRVVDAIKQMPEHARYLRGMFSWIGFKQAPVLYDRDKRFAGETHYPLKKMLKLAIDGIISFSDKPLFIPILLGILLGGVSGIGLLALLVRLILGLQSGLWWLAAWVTMLFALLFMVIGIEGRYIDRIYREVQGRPLYFVAETRGFDTPSEEK